MIKVIMTLLFILVLVLTVQISSATYIEWNRTFGWIGDESGEYAYSLPNGFMLAGKSCEVWLIRTDAEGNMIDSHYFERATAITKTSDGNAIVGISKGKIWLVETDKLGKRKWMALVDGNFQPKVKPSKDGYFIYGIESRSKNESVIRVIKLAKIERRTEIKGVELWNLSITTDARSDLFLLPTSDGGCLLLINVERNNGDILIVKINSSGKIEWNRTIGSKEYDRIEVWYNHYNPAIEEDGFVIAATTTKPRTGSTNSDVWLIKLDKSGKEVWNGTYGGDRFEKAVSIVNASDGYVIAGVTDSYGYGNNGNCKGNGECNGHCNGQNLNIWLFKVDKNGNEVWNSTFGGKGMEGVSCLRRVKDGYLISGWTNSFRDAKIKAKESPSYPYWTAGWLVKVDTKGKELWNLTFGGVGKDLIGCAEAVEVNNSTGYIIAGTTTSYSSGIHDAWLIKVDEEMQSVKVNDSTANKTANKPGGLVKSTINPEPNPTIQKTPGFGAIFALISIIIALIRFKYT